MVESDRDTEKYRELYNLSKEVFVEEQIAGYLYRVVQEIQRGIGTQLYNNRLPRKKIGTRIFHDHNHSLHACFIFRPVFFI